MNNEPIKINSTVVALLRYAKRNLRGDSHRSGTVRGGERLWFSREEPRNSFYSRFGGLEGVVHNSMVREIISAFRIARVDWCKEVLCEGDS